MPPVGSESGPPVGEGKSLDDVLLLFVSDVPRDAPVVNQGIRGRLLLHLQLLVPQVGLGELAVDGHGNHHVVTGGRCGRGQGQEEDKLRGWR